jgi:hypothetical protein
VIRTKAKHIEELAQSMGTYVLAIQETAQLEGRTLPLSVFMKQLGLRQTRRALSPMVGRGNGKRRCPLQAASLQRI